MNLFVEVNDKEVINLLRIDIKRNYWNPRHNDDACIARIA